MVAATVGAISIGHEEQRLCAVVARCLAMLLVAHDAASHPVPEQTLALRQLCESLKPLGQFITTLLPCPLFSILCSLLSSILSSPLSFLSSSPLSSPLSSLLLYPLSSLLLLYLPFSSLFYNAKRGSG